MSTNLNLQINVKANVKNAIGGLKNLGTSVGGLKGTVGKLGSAFSVAAGNMIANFASSAIQTIGEVITLGGQIKTLKDSFERLTVTTGATGLTLESLQTATQNMVPDIDLLTSANQAMLLGLPTEGIEELFGAAIKLGNAMGIDAAFAVDSLTKGIGRQSKMILDNLGVIIDTNQAYQTYADSVGKSVDELDDSERKLAFQEAAMEAVRSKAEELGDITSNVTTKQAQMATKVDNLKAAIGEGLAPVVSAIADFLLIHFFPALETIGAFITIHLIPAFQSIATWLGDNVLPVLESVAKFIQDTAIAAWEGILSIVKGVSDAIEGLLGFFKDVNNFFGGIGDAIGNFFGGLGGQAKEGMADTTDEWSSGLKNMRDETGEFYNDMVGHSLWTDLMKGMVKETEKGLGKVKGEFADLETITPQVAHTFSPITSPAMSGGGGGGPIEVNINVQTGDLHEAADENRLADKISERMLEEFRSLDLVMG